MDTLPTEILERIIRFKSISPNDLRSFSETCRRFRNVGASNDIWKEKFFQCFSQLFQKLKPVIQTRRSLIDWKTELKKRILTEMEVNHEVSSMSPRLYLDSELSFTDFAWFDDLLSKHNPDRSFIHFYVVDALLQILVKKEKEEHLTIKYYSAKVLSHVQRRLLRGNLSDMWPGEEGPHSYEEVMVVVAQWSQPCMDISNMETANILDSLVEAVLKHLLQTQPGHIIFQHIASQQANTATPILTRVPILPVEMRNSFWDPNQCRQILEASNYIFYSKEGFGGNTDDYYNPENSYINRVLQTRKGIPITLCILYCCILRRLGVILLPINFPGHFLLKWESHPDLKEEERFTYIDAFDGGKHVTATEVRERVPHLVTDHDSYIVASPGDCARRMLRNLISIGASRPNNMRDSNYSLLRSSLELMLVINLTDSTQYSFMLSRIYLQLNINHDEVLNLLSEQRDNPGLSDQVDYLLHQCQVQMAEREHERVRDEPKLRDKSLEGIVTLRVGQVCRHRKYHYTCVIYGWDPICTASQSWITHMGVDKLDYKDKQPFYNVLVGDGSQRYAAQENLIALTTPCPVPHPEVGKYFTALDTKNGYIPNNELHKDYPEEDKLKGS